MGNYFTYCWGAGRVLGSCLNLTPFKGIGIGLAVSQLILKLNKDPEQQTCNPGEEGLESQTTVRAEPSTNRV